MRFWDASALVPLLDPSADRAALEALLQKDRETVVWWGSLVECESALRRQERDRTISHEEAQQARARLRAWQSVWVEIQPGERLRETAVRLLAVHALRAGDALQLAAAFAAARGEPRTLPFVCLDRRLAESAAREGFEIVATA